jgi:CDP-diacylglycerol--glycerol-3-phosphate 3-phosphatidyltransferase
LLTDLVTKDRLRRWALPLTRLVAQAGLTPNMLTVIGFLLNAGVAAVLATGRWQLGGVLLLLASAFDLLDGAVAQYAHKATAFGAFLDSNLDRLSEAVIYFGLLWVYAPQGMTTEILLIYATIVGSLLVSYARARAEGLGLKCEVGLLARPERVILLALGLLLNQVTIALWLLAVLTNLTAGQRVLHVWRILQNQQKLPPNPLT